MCGICGICFKDKRPVDLNIIRSMNNALLPRGPDDEGYYVSSGVGFGMRRLKVIDLETGNQPIINEDGSIIVVYNGEIYNFLELKNDLIKKGHIFHTRTDTEVLVHLYEEEGADFLKKLNGMFAFALWDAKKHSLLLARDQTGIKPLYYFINKDCLVFGSELKALLRCPFIDANIDPVSIKKYLIYEYVPSPASIFKNINKLPPAHFMLYRNGEPALKNYWALNLEKRNKMQMPEAEERLRELIADSVRIRLVSDVPIGSFLSGGIDSSTISYFMARSHPDKIKTFSIVFDDPSFDESRYFRMISGGLGTDHHERVMTSKDLLNAIPAVFNFLDEPLGDASIVPTYLLSGFTKENVTVALSGDGGDELFAGYPTYIAHNIARYYKRFIPEILHKRVILPLVRAIPVSFDNISFDFKLKRFMEFALLPPHLRNVFWLGSFVPDEIRDLLQDDYTNWDFIEKQAIIPEMEHCPHETEKMQIADFHLYLPEDILTKVDRASMACSLEVRIPFLDPRIIEFVWSLPFSMKLRGLKTKYILKNAMSNLLPQTVIRRRKKGFGIPVAKWFSSELKEMLMDTFSESRLRNDGIFNRRYIQKLLSEHFSRRADHRKKLWTLFVFQNWMERWTRADF